MDLVQQDCDQEVNNKDNTGTTTTMPLIATTTPRPACLICIDGWGMAEQGTTTPPDDGDAIQAASTPWMDRLGTKDSKHHGANNTTYPSIPLAAHGLAVGLPAGLMGNSEVGHLNIGAGRVVYQDIVRIELAIAKRTLSALPHLQSAFASARGGRLHLVGLVSDGGVHSHITHLFALLEAAKAALAPSSIPTYIHIIGDGRDTAPMSLIGYAEQLQSFIQTLGYGHIATVCGRYYAMDRDKRWDRIQLAYEAYVGGVGERISTPLSAAIAARYEAGETDEFLKPMIIDPKGVLRAHDSCICFNYRSDRMREITQALAPSMAPPPFETTFPVPSPLTITTMTQYKAEYPFPVLFPPQVMDNVLAQVLANHNIPQCHIAETEKYAHVTFFFNGGTEAAFAGEERVMIPSPKVATYDLLPEMSAIAVAEAVAKHIEEGKYPFVMCNFAPPDMVGHTGKYECAIKAVEATDRGIGIIYEACVRAGYTLFVTADHGNAEKMKAPDGSPHTAHTCNKVPFIMTTREASLTANVIGEPEVPALCDVAPTILDWMGVPIPAEMTGRSLLVRK